MTIGENPASGRKPSVGELRRAQMITSFGPGAIADLKDMSVVVGATDNWHQKCKKISDRNLAVLLGVKEFREPVSPYVGDNEATVPVHRFPYWHYCPSCHKLAPFWVIGDKDKKKCADCGVPLIPSRFVVACENGHLEDFPYRWWIHRGGDCGSNAPLKISFSNKTRGVEGIKITCPECGANRTMAGCTAKDALAGHRCFGKRPWIGRNKAASDPEPCDCHMVALQRTASNVYYPVTVSALTMPPTASNAVEHYWPQIQGLLKLGFDEETLRNSIKALMVVEELNESALDEVMYEIELKGASAGGASLTKQRILQSEYHALVGDDYDGQNLKTVHVSVPRGFEGLIEGVTLVKRLREILVIEGFRRISPERTDGSEDMCALWKEDQDWLPGIELLGEGIFIKLNQEAVSAWSERVGDRYEKMRRRLQKSNVRCDAFSPQYVMLHTLAHALIRQLSMECGYSATSLSERIYSTYPGDEYKMCGILVYTSSSDSDGSLGGLVRCGNPIRLSVTLSDALQNIAWCSSDPLCEEAEAQGYKSLNYAACHACALLPETSCEMRNCLLDRVALVGTPEEPALGFFTGADAEFDTNSLGAVELDEWAAIESQLVDEESVSFLRRVRELGLPAPDTVGMELDEGEMAELAWEELWVCYLMESQRSDTSAFEAEGWTVIYGDSDDADIVDELGVS